MNEQPMKKATNPTTVKPPRKYAHAYNQQAWLLLRQGQSLPAVAQALGISVGLLYRWKPALRPPLVEQELVQLRLKLKPVEPERDILKNALTIFTRQT
jgi:transposase-like protein